MLDAQRTHWNATYAAAPGKFGWEPSWPARYASDVFDRCAAATILEIGCGQGRDTLFFAAQGRFVRALDYAASALDDLMRRARELDLERRVSVSEHDVRMPLPVADASVDGVFAHMLHNMALRDDQIVTIFAETYRVLKPGGVVVFSVRNLDDPDARAGRALSAYLRDVDGDVIRFFSKRCVRRFTRGFAIESRSEFEEGTLPKRLFLVTLRKASGS